MEIKKEEKMELYIYNYNGDQKIKKLTKILQKQLILKNITQKRMKRGLNL